MVMNTPPNDARNFVHKRLFGAAKGLLTSGFNPLSAVGGFLAPPTDRGAAATMPRSIRRAGLSPRSRGISRAVVRTPTSRTLTARPDATSAAQKRLGLATKFGGVSALTVPSLPVVGCVPPFFDDGRGGCELDIVPGPGGGGTGAQRDIGETVMGRYGAGEVPGNMPINRAICRRGMVLGNDGICYNRTQISNKEREWPRGRRPLLTGGDMRAISTAARAGKRLEGATKRLQKIGLMKKPAPRKSAAQIHHAK